MRADRLITILLLLQSHGKMTAKQLAERLEVSERTVYRDMEALSRAGIPVVADRGVGGGWRLMEKYRTNLTGFKEKEIQALFVSPPAHLLDDLGLTRSAEDARNKLLAAIPDTYRHGAKEVWQRIHVDTRAWRKPEETVAAFETLQQAIWEEKRLHILYRRSDGDTVERTVDPLGLVAKGSVWYLVASIDETVRTYRASRILSATPTNERFVRPTDFDLAQYWESSTQAFIDHLPEYEIQVEAAPSVLPKLPYAGWFAKIRAVGHPLDSGWIPVTLCFDTEEEAKAFVLGFGDNMKVVEPSCLAREVVKMAHAVVQFYGESVKQGGASLASEGSDVDKVAVQSDEKK